MKDPSKISVYCMQCGKRFFASKMKLRWGGDTVCSQECADKVNQRMQWKEEELDGKIPYKA